MTPRLPKEKLLLSALTEPVRVLICGSRDWTDYEAIRRFVFALPHGSTVIEGEARGADKMARIAANDRGLSFIPYPADWSRYGRGAGPVRNQQMIVSGQPELVVFFHEDLAASKGTKNMVEQSIHYGLPVYDGATLERFEKDDL